uniref:T-cell surface glycoprotein CD3 epsilon chain-like n=1 Tax=Neolamprologus brichardi TaxID=32507 RepID=A0A3Q4HUW9_NEOBR
KKMLSMGVQAVLVVVLLGVATTKAEEPQGNMCENCFELNGDTLFTVIVGDLLLTIIMMVIVYRCTKKKSSAGPPQPSKAPPRSGGRGPPVPSPDYEALNPQTRAQDTYSTVVNRMG